MNIFNILNKVMLFGSIFIIFWSMIGYPLSLKIFDKFKKSKLVMKNYNYLPTVTVMVVAHNEEKVILDKLKNIIQLEYPNNKIEFLITSDNSTDSTNEIVKDFISSNLNHKISLYEVKEHKGKTNAQNEAQKTISSEYIVMTDANSMLDKNAIKELMAAYVSDNIAYVCGLLTIINKDSSFVSDAEARYWGIDTKIREIESRLQTITAGNGALYSCRTKDYHDFNPVQSHDSEMPIYYGLLGKRAIANHDAIAFEKAGEVIEDEFLRKVRMNRVMLKHIIPNFRIFNIFKYKWLSYFYFGHRTCRYLLWMAHLLLLLASIFLISLSYLYLSIFIGQIVFYLLAMIKLVTQSKNKYLCMIYYYTITIIAQWIGIFRVITGKAKPYWEKAESTR